MPKVSFIHFHIFKKPLILISILACARASACAGLSSTVAPPPAMRQQSSISIHKFHMQKVSLQEKVRIKEGGPGGRRYLDGISFAASDGYEVEKALMMKKKTGGRKWRLRLLTYSLCVYTSSHYPVFQRAHGKRFLSLGRGPLHCAWERRYEPNLVVRGEMIALRKHMAYTTKFLHPIRHYLTIISSHSSSSSHFKRFSRLWKIRFRENISEEPGTFTLRTCLHSSIRCKKFCCGSILGLSIAYGSVAAYAMDAQDALVDDPDEDSLDLTEEEKNRHQLWTFARKFWLPAFLFLTVLANLYDPIPLLLIKVTLFFLSTKPNPYSVYIFVDQLCQQSMRQEPSLRKVKSLYARKVEVRDYKLLCLANVEVRDQNFTLVGILGNWWSLPHILPQEAFSLLRDRFLEKIAREGNRAADAFASYAYNTSFHLAFVSNPPLEVVSVIDADRRGLGSVRAVVV
ncbi:uncharacterized protein G2W53_025003 [Senna tora]|uniref:Uncharacterized protein n=1 Tax=Senna tora TaxID=362788 RepID=A0A834TCM3_9FABA|nr:uncharacterized protein G2W53_025003 [Senna tora]